MQQTTDYDIVGGFDTIAKGYDKTNDAMTGGMHRYWRGAFCRKAAEVSPQNGRVLDVATGTGDVIVGLLKARPDLQVVGIDPSAGMLEVGREKLVALGKPFSDVSMDEGDARKMPYGDSSFDTVTTAWGIRNIVPYEDGLKEFRRVLKPGGTVCILESGRPESLLMRLVLKVYSLGIPLIGGLLTGYARAYAYYIASADAFESGKDFCRALDQNGFRDAQYIPFMGGIIYLYTAVAEK